MVDPLSAIQSTEAIVSLFALTVKVIEYCRRLANAEKSAARILDRIENFKTVLEGPAAALRAHRTPNSDQVSPNEHVKLYGHIDVAIKGCQKILKEIDRIFENFDGSLNARREFLSHAKEINDLLAQLDGQKITLLIAFATIGFNDQQRNLTPGPVQNNRIQAITVNVNYGYEYFCNALKQPQPSEIDSNSLSLLENDFSDAQLRTFEDLLSVRDLAKGVLDRLNSARRPSAGSRKDSAATILIEEIETKRLSSASSSSSSPPLLIEPQRVESNDFRYIGIATGQMIRAISDPALLDHSIGAYLGRASENIRMSNYDEAEESLEKAVAYSEQREQMDGGVPFVGKVDLLEKLADVSLKVCNWTAAIRVLEILLGGKRPTAPEDDLEPGGATVRHARQSQSLASVYFDKSCMISNEKVLEEASWIADHAWNIWERIRKVRSFTPVEEKLWLSCGRLLERIWKLDGSEAEASYYGQDRLRGLLRSPEMSVVQDGILGMGLSTEPERGRRSSIHSGSDRTRTNDFEAAKNAVRTSHIFLLDQLFNSSESILSINDKFNKGTTILHYAASKGATAMVTKLLRMKADLTMKDDAQETALVKAVKEDHHEVVKLLLRWPGGTQELGASLTDGQSILHYAIQRGALKSMKILLEHDNNLINSKDRDGRTPLHQCAEDGAADRAAILFPFQPECIAQDNRGRTPGNLAVKTRDNHHQVLFKSLMDYHVKKSPGMNETARVESIVNKKMLTKRENEILTAFLAMYRKAKKEEEKTANVVETVRLTRESSIDTPTSPKSVGSGGKGKIPFFGRRKM